MQENTNKTAGYTIHPLMADAISAFREAFTIMGKPKADRQYDVAQRLLDHARRNVASGVVTSWLLDREAFDNPPVECTEAQMREEGWRVVAGIWTTAPN